MTDPDRRSVWSREELRSDVGLAPRAGAVMAAMRTGIGRSPGEVPAMWPWYTTLTDSPEPSRELLAEHLAMTLFGVHQQSLEEWMHRHGGNRLGDATRILKARQGASGGPASDSDSAGHSAPSGIDRRLAAAATASSWAELEHHLRQIVTLLRGEGIPLDYDRLLEDLVRWQTPADKPRVLRRWAAQHFAPVKPDKTDSAQERNPQ